MQAQPFDGEAMLDTEEMEADRDILGAVSMLVAVMLAAGQIRDLREE